MQDQVKGMSPYVAKIKAAKNSSEKKKFKMLFLVKKADRESGRNDEIFEDQVLSSVESLSQKIDMIASSINIGSGGSNRKGRGSMVGKFVFGDGPLSTRPNYAAQTPRRFRKVEKIRPL